MSTASRSPNEWLDPVEQWDHEDAPRRDEADRYAIYALDPTSSARRRAGERRRLCETSLSGIGPGVLLMLREDEVPRGWRIGVFDRLTRLWLINPYA